MELRLFLASFLLSHVLLLPVSSQASQSNPSTCPENFECGSLGSLTFPYTYWTNLPCGLCMLDCDHKPFSTITFQIPQEKWFEVKSITNSTIKLHDPVLEGHLKDPNCSFLGYDIGLPRYQSIAFTILNNITLFGCNKEPETTNLRMVFFGDDRYYFYNECEEFTIYFRLPNGQTSAVHKPSNCTSFLLPAVSLYNNNSEDPELLDLLTAEFDVQWHLSGDCYNCYHEGQTCRTDRSVGLGPRCAIAEKGAGKKNSKVSLGKGKAWIWIVVASSSVLFILLLGLFWYRRVQKHNQKEMEKRLQDNYIYHLTESDSLNNIDEMGKTAGKPHDMKIFSFGSIMAATDDFSSENKLGEGGFGPVYKGKLLDGREIAVKRLSRKSGQGLVEFKNELILISKLQHTNLVRVLGCCIHGEEKMLIYEYMPNKSLDFFLFAQDKKKLLDWQKRFNIIEGIAQGLLYLHKYSRMRVIHRDLKASNVLLDENMNPKIADFGMARIFKQNETEAITKRVVGTYGYMSPEYAMEGTFSVKSDVFSFGVLILEIITGRKNSSLYNLDDYQLNLVGCTWMLWKKGVALDLKDPALGDSCDINQLLRAVHVGLLCVQENAVDRPNMSEVISMLNNGTMPLLAPKQPAFFTGRRALDSTSSEIESTGNPADNLQNSANELSISVLEAR